jgi:uncharacterized SAM-binding protein YcdF (DUF218 family)
MSQALLRIAGGVAVLSFLVAAFSPAVNVVSYWMTPPPRRSEPVQAIVVLGSGGVAASGGLTDTSMRGAMDGIALYQEGLAPLVVFSGSPEGNPKGEAEARADLARSCGVPASAIVTSSHARTTSEEAQRIHALLASREIRKIMLVADTPGMGRAMRAFELVGFDVVPAPRTEILELGGSPEDRLSLLRQVALELVARVYYRVAGYS